MSARSAVTRDTVKSGKADMPSRMNANAEGFAGNALPGS